MKTTVSCSVVISPRTFHSCICWNQSLKWREFSAVCVGLSVYKLAQPPPRRTGKVMEPAWLLEKFQPSWVTSYGHRPDALYAHFESLCVTPWDGYWSNDLAISFLRKSFLYTPEEVFNVLTLLSGKWLQLTLLGGVFSLPRRLLSARTQTQEQNHWNPVNSEEAD